MDSIGQRLTSERKRLKLSVDAFSEALGVHRNTQAHYESDERSPKAAYWEAAAKAGVNVAFVTSGQLNMTRLVNLPKHYESDVLSDYWLLLAHHLEESMLAAGAVAGRDYTHKDLWQLTQPMVVARLGQLRVDISDPLGLKD